MKYRELVRLLVAAGYERSEGKGDHEKCKHGDGLVVITQTREVSPGRTRKALQTIERTRAREEGEG